MLFHTFSVVLFESNYVHLNFIDYCQLRFVNKYQVSQVFHVANIVSFQN